MEPILQTLTDLNIPYEYWNDIKKRYLEKKNFYLRKQDQTHPSFVVFVETINEVYYQHLR